MQGLSWSLPQVQTPNCDFLLILNTLIFAGERSDSLFAWGQYSCGLYRNQRRLPVFQRPVSKQVQYPQMSPLSLTAFFIDPEVWRNDVLNPSSHPLSILSSLGFIQDICKYSFDTLLWFRDQTVLLKLASPQPISCGTLSLLKVPKYFSYSFGNRGCFSKTLLSFEVFSLLF